ncbi:MAG: hypothetical protein WCF04_03800 [Candidatus Nanopelagicales bacterium]
MRPSRPLALTVLLASGMLLAGCRSEPAPQGSGSPTPSASATTSTATPGSPSPSATSTLTAAQEEAFAQATDVVMAYRQTITDLYSGARTRINDLDNYATGDLLDQDRTAVSLGVRQGIRSEPAGVQLVLVSAEPESVKLKADPPTVVLRACIDATDVTDVLADGTRRPGVREQLQYTVVKTAYLPDPGWAVLRLKGGTEPEDRAC